MSLKAKGIIAAIRGDEDLFHNTRNPRYAWHAWQLARQTDTPVPVWVLRFVDELAATQIAVWNRKTDTADRYEAALTQMEVAVAAHRRRLTIRKVGRTFGVKVDVSRRDKPNLTAIARAAANANGVSQNRLLARYRSTQKATKR